MFELFISYLQFGKYYCGIEHTLLNNEVIIYTTILKKKKKEVVLSSLFSSKSIEEGSKKLSKKQHILLIINNEHVLTKILENETLDSIKLVNTAFPNINLAEFYFEIIQQSSKYFISICRKSYVDSIIESYSNLGVYVVNFSLGNSLVSNVISYIDNSSVSTSNALITCHNNFIEAIDLIQNINEVHYNINGLNTPNYNLLSLSGALSRVLNNYNPFISFQEKRDKLVNEFTQIRFFSQFLNFGLVFILGLLIVNFLLFNFYFNEVNTLNETSQLNQKTKNKILKLDKKVSKAQKMTDDMLKSNSSKSSFYVNAIINSLPESILLSEINYQPLAKNIKKDKAIAIHQNNIVVSGTSNNSSIYSDWITFLEGLNWVNKVEVENYNDSKYSSNFSIKIRLANDE